MSMCALEVMLKRSLEGIEAMHEGGEKSWLLSG